MIITFEGTTSEVRRAKNELLSTLATEKGVDYKIQKDRPALFKIKVRGICDEDLLYNGGE